MEDTIHNFIQTAARTFKRFYGVYPDRLGLDMFTRMKQYNKLHFFEYYHWQEMSDIEMMAPFRESIIRYERVQIRIDPAVFGKITYYPDTPVVDWKKPPKRGYDKVLCEGNGISVLMTLWFTEQGYYAIVWDNMEKQQQHNLFQQYLQRMGYQIEQSRPVFEELLPLFLSGDLWKEDTSGFMPLYVWISAVGEKLLEPYKQLGGF